MIDPPNDDRLVEALKNGDRNALEVIIRRYNERLYRIGLVYLKNSEDTEDAMQDAYIRVYQKIGQFRGRSKFSTWLTRIMINECLQRLRSRKTYAVELPESDALPVALIQTTTPESAIIQTEIRAVLEKAIRSLPRTYQSVFMLREIEGLSTEETAACLKISTANVKVRLHRSKSLIQNHLHQNVESAELFPFHRNRCDRIVERVRETILRNSE